MSPTNVLVVAKAPVPGLAKTRLIPALGPAGAADVAAAALLDTLDAARAAAERLGGRVVVALTGDLGQAGRRDRLREALSGCDVVQQRGFDFADRLAAAHQDAAAGGGPVLQIGMDTPQVSADLLTGCAEDLAGADAVLAPAEDGGWWALAVRAPEQAKVLAGVPMSTNRTGELTAAALRDAGLRVVTGPPLRDVDTITDALAVAELAPRTRFAEALRSLHAGSLR